MSCIQIKLIHLTKQIKLKHIACVIVIGSIFLSVSLVEIDKIIQTTDTPSGSLSRGNFMQSNI